MYGLVHKISTEKALEKNLLSTKKEKNQWNHGKTFGRNPQILYPHAQEGAWLTFKPSQSFPRGAIVEELGFPEQGYSQPQ